MPESLQIEVKNLSLDLNNFRTVPQKKESDAIKAMISIKPERFFAIIDSIIEDGYLPTENIIVINKSKQYIVKEGNRRIAALKLIHGIHKPENFGLPASIIKSINEVSEDWKKENAKVPCSVFSVKETDVADRIVTLAHGKGEKAGRDPWNSIARARHNRDVKGAIESGLDLLEKYLIKGNNINNQQKERWAGNYPITVLDEALRKLFSRIGEKSVTDLVKNYPKIKFLNELEEILLDIGLEQIKFETIRKAEVDFPTNYGIPPLNVSSNTSSTSATSNQNSTPQASTTNQSSTTGTNSGNTSSAQTQNVTNPTTNQTSTTTPTPSTPKAVAINDPKNVTNLLKKFIPRGQNRQKVVSLRDELKNLKISNNPIAFCFILRSMFEISAKAYCNDNNINVTKSGGKDKTLVEILRSVTAHLTGNNSNIPMTKVLHGALTELAKSDSILSVTSMNHLVHNPNFSIAPTDICIMFANVYPLLESMN